MPPKSSSARRWLTAMTATGVFAVVVAVMMLWLSGRFSPKVGINEPTEPEGRPVPSGAVVEVRTVSVPMTEPAVGTVQALHETTIASRILARVVEANLTAGQKVKTGDVLFKLDDTDLKARLQQAEAAADSAKAEHDQAVILEHRLGSLIASKAVSQTDYDKAQTALRMTEAGLARADQAVVESKAILAYAQILSPMDGIVVDKKVDVGDTASPGLPLVTIYDPAHMQLVASVRESLARHLSVGQRIQVHLDALDVSCDARVSEIVPDAQSASRTFQVKVVGAFPAGLYTGMFGRIFIPLEQRQMLVIPKSAIRYVGQLELVDVVDGQVARRRAIRTGQSIGTDCEVLSGLEPGEKVVATVTESASAHTRVTGAQL